MRSLGFFFPKFIAIALRSDVAPQVPILAAWQVGAGDWWAPSVVVDMSTGCGARPVCRMRSFRKSGLLHANEVCAHVLHVCSDCCDPDR
eukprot:901790-Pyramimonas_sp.AAC.1